MGVGTAALMPIVGGVDGDLTAWGSMLSSSSVSIRSVFQIMLRSDTADIGDARGDLVDLFHALRKQRGVAEDGGVGGHRALHVEADFGGG